MSAVPVTIQGVLYDLYGRTTQVVVLMGDASLSGVGVGGGPIIPPPVSGPPGQPIHPIWGPPGFNPPGPGMPPGIWGGPIIPPPVPPGIPGVPTFPIWGPPGIDFPDKPGYPPVVGGGPIIPPPNTEPPVEVPPGTVVIPPGNQPVQPIVPPKWIVVFYPGVGWVLVGKPITGDDNPQKR